MELRWGNFTFASTAEVATEHFLVTGATGSGKTVLINRLMFGVFAAKPDDPAASETPCRALVYDPKQDVVSLLSGFPLYGEGRLKILNPFDRRGFAWNMAADIKTPVEARQVATILIPEGRGRERESFFVDATRDLLAGVMMTFAACVPKPRWTFRDVILTMLYEPYLDRILRFNKTREGAPFIFNRRLRDSYLGGADPSKADVRTIANIRSTINSKLSIYEPVAAAWAKASKAKNEISLAQWVKGSDVLVLGNDEAARAPLDAINRAIFKRITELTLSQKELARDRKRTGEGFSWFILDEVREAGELDGLSRLMTKGRSKGACVVLGFQDIDGLRDVYGHEVANEIAGQCGHAAILRLSSPSTAEWAASMFGTRLVDGKGKQFGGQGFSFSTQEGEQKMIYSGDILFLERTSPETGLVGAFKSVRAARGQSGMHELDWKRHIEAYLPKRGPEADFLPIDAKDQYLTPWTKADWNRLGFQKGNPPDLFESLRSKTGRALDNLFKGMDPGTDL